MAAKLLLLALAVTASTAAPQFSEESDLPPTPHDFGYGVSVPETGDAKEHKQSVSPSGRTEGEYRWLQPNGLFRVVRYYVEGNSGFQAEVSEEPGPDVSNYYSNSLTQENSQGGVPVASQSLAKSLDAGRSSFGTAANVISAPDPLLPSGLPPHRAPSSGASPSHSPGHSRLSSVSLPPSETLLTAGSSMAALSTEESSTAASSTGE